MNLRRIILSKYHILKMLGGETMANQSKNKLVVPGAKVAIDNMKAEIANELGVQMGADATARQNGSVGGEITKRLVAQAQQQMNQTK